jgi:DNA polymerase III delta subunit
VASYRLVVFSVNSVVEPRNPGDCERDRGVTAINNLVGFYHIFNTPRTDELRAILEARWQNQQVTIEDGAIEMLEKVTSSNIRKLVNINAEMSRVCELNSISIITPDLVQLASVWRQDFCRLTTD